MWQAVKPCIRALEKLYAGALRDVLPVVVQNVKRVAVLHILEDDEIVSVFGAEADSELLPIPTPRVISDPLWRLRHNTGKLLVKSTGPCRAALARLEHNPWTTSRANHHEMSSSPIA